MASRLRSPRPEPSPTPGAAAGEYQDVSTGLYKMGARYYQPELGRWTQQDPSCQEANAYAYVVNFVDPSGLFSFGDFFGNIADVASLAAAVSAAACFGGVGCYVAGVLTVVSAAAAAAGETAKECTGGDECADAVGGLLFDVAGAAAFRKGQIGFSVLIDFLAASLGISD